MKFKQITKEFTDWEGLREIKIDSFPAHERLPFEHHLEMVEKGEGEFVGIYDKELIGYYVIRIYEGIGFIEYFAISSKFRGRGYGTQALRKIKEVYPNLQIVLEIERIDPQADNLDQRIRRKKFYLRNGYFETGEFVSYLGMDLEILCEEPDFKLEIFKEMMFSIYYPGFNPVFSKE